MNNYSEDERKQLLQLATDAIAYGVEHGKIMPLHPRRYCDKLLAERAVFVTLEIAGQLRGCIGSLKAHRPLIEDVVHNAYAAAFSDPRFPPVSKEELPQLDIHISILDRPEAMHFTSEEDLIAQLRPGIDGLILADKGYRGTFLPSVWETLPDKAQFLAHLKVKAGLPENYWSQTLRVERYTVEVISAS